MEKRIETGLSIVKQQEGINLLIDLIHKNSLVPFIGSGFTGGAPAFGGDVPMGPELMEIMKKEILRPGNDEDEESLSQCDFTELAEKFLDEDNVHLDVRFEILKNYFTEVQLPQYKADFLKIWKYIYTINIDDGIENACGYKVVLPYASLRDSPLNLFKGKHYVLKLHGDAAKEIETEGEFNMVLSSTQYITSLREQSNENILSSVYSDYKQKNLIFIGCSLAKEIDLQQIYKDIKKDILSNKIIYLCSNIPDKQTQKNLRKYGINTLLIVDNYDSFYKNIVIEFNKQKDVVRYRYINPETNILKSKDAIIKLFALGRPTFDIRTGYFSVPVCKAQRDTISTIVQAVHVHSFVFIKGRRLSGKTTLLQSLIAAMPAYRQIVFFPSGYAVDTETFQALLEDCHESLFVFDSNTLSPEVYRELILSRKSLLENGAKVIIATNINEDYLEGKLSAYVVVLSPQFSLNELDDFNSQVDRLAFIRRYRSDTTLDYSWRLMEQQRLQSPFSNCPVDGWSLNQKIILYMLVVFDCVYAHELSRLDISLCEAEAFTSSNQELFEKIDCDPNESEGKSVFKYVHNSRYIAISLLTRINKDDIVNIVCKVVKKLYLDDPYQYKSIIMYDTFNNIFSQKKGAGHLIDEVYEKLEKILYAEPHFWLQRAKSIYRLYKEDRKRLEDARSYAIKTFSDPHIESYTKIKASFTLALIYCLLHKLTSDIDEKIVFELRAIEHAYLALISSKNMLIFIKNDRVDSAFSLLFEICDSFISRPEKAKEYHPTFQKALDIIKFLNELRRTFSRYL